AEIIGMHESTVSRVTSNKFLATPRGTYELKYFFSAALGGSGGEEHAAEAVRDRIKALIAGESAEQVLSDDAIVDKLKAEGIEIARRTVAKYREALNIPSSVQRRREKALVLARWMAAGARAARPSGRCLTRPGGAHTVPAARGARPVDGREDGA